MKIGIIGAPGAGKTQFAKALGTKYQLKVVDNYVQSLQKSTGLALGPWSSYSEHVMTAGQRLAAESKAGVDNRITAGTLLDSIAYTALKSDRDIQIKTKEDRITLFNTAQGIMAALGVMLAETWDYNLTFFLPLDDVKKEEYGQSWQVNLDSAYPTVIDSFGVSWIYPLTGDIKNKIKVAKEMIDLATKEKTTETD